MTEPMGRTFAHSIANVARGLQTSFDAHLKGMGLTAARGRVLFYLVNRPEGATQSEVTDFLQVENPTAVRILDGLEELGYVERQPSPHDRRAKLIVLTPRGKPIADEVVVSSRALLAELVADIDADDLAVTAAVLDKIAANITTLGMRRSSMPEAELSL
jgi:MarR family transcriptional regulator for hemolysin